MKPGSWLHSCLGFAALELNNPMSIHSKLQLSCQERKKISAIRSDSDTERAGIRYSRYLYSLR